ncbi:MAG: RNA polymerase sigma factor [Minisyncoccia bacterium]
MTEQEFSQFYKQNLDKVFRFIYLRVDKVEIAQDLTSQSFLKVWQSNNLSQRKIKNHQAFLFQVARHQIIDFYRQKNKMPVSLDELSEKGIEISQKSFASQIELNVEMENLKKKLQLINSAYSEVIIWHYVDNFSIKEIAEILGKNENNVRVLLHRALENLKKECNTLP